MQKKIIALAVAGLVSGAAFAQSNVTLYGRLDLGYTYSKTDYRKFQGIENGNGLGGGGNRVGVRGEEALGNGLKAVFEVEWEFAADKGEGLITPRWAYAGLAGKFGQVRLGRIRTPGDVWTGVSAVNGFSGYEPVNLFRAKMDNIAGRWDDSVAYYSPNFSGLDFMAIYSFGEKVNGEKNSNGSYSNNNTCGSNTNVYPNVPRDCDSADTSDAGKFGLGVRYANGPLNLVASYHARVDDDSARRLDPVTGNYSDHGWGRKGWIIGGAYDFKVVKVYANYMRTKANHDGLATTADSGTDKQTAWSLSVSVPVSSAGTVIAQYAQYKDYLNAGSNGRFSGANLIPTNNSVGDPGHKAKGYTIGYNHTLSKRTSLYTYLVRIDNDRGIHAGWDKTGVTGEDQTIFTAGLLHHF
jgi:predicted porin